ncbi:MAG: cation diffusion facilitator family transporter [Thermoplasmata archaeon]|jgi:cation diffusion facilitator family transporter|nr:cation diffusion facilitator family transporter [Thermoplasmata archaeon]
MRPQVIIIATLLLNASLFAVNLTVALLSGSRAVLSQAIYTITDLVGSAFLLWGLYLSRRPADYDRPFGHGRERFFWAFVSIVVTFTVAGLLALTIGFEQLSSPVKVTHIGYGLIVVGGTVLASLAGIYITLRELRHSRETLGSLLASANQGLKSIFYQDLVAIVGSVAAFVGLLVVYKTGNNAVDGFTAVVEGLILFAAGVVLSAESREYLVGRALQPADTRAILSIVERDPRVAKVRGLYSMLLGPDDALLALRINFQDGLTTDQIEQTIDRVTAAIRQVRPTVHHVVIEPES